MSSEYWYYAGNARVDEAHDHRAADIEEQAEISYPVSCRSCRNRADFPSLYRETTYVIFERRVNNHAPGYL